jgi:hypothetical protein
MRVDMGEDRASAEVAERGVSLLDVMATSYSRVEAGTASAEEAETWRTFWLALLREYDRVCEQLTDL